MVASIIDIVRDFYGSDVDIKVIEADASAMRTKYAFKALDYEKLSIHKKVELFNLSKDESLNKKISINKKNIELKIPKILTENNLLINVPKLKTIDITKITCSMKNLFGCLSVRRKIRYHDNIEEVIIAINKIIIPDVNIVDALVCYPNYPKKLNLIISGKNTFDVDYIGGSILGYNPKNINYLRLANKEKIGDFNNIEVKGEKISYFANQIKKPLLSSLISNKMLLELLHLYAYIVGDIVPPSLE
jgi:uncharacterized protein (DUF362 family)